MKKGGLISLFLAVLMVCFACARQEEQGQLLRVTFARGHSSVWGNQLRLDITSDNILYAHFFLEELPGELQERTDVPITSDQWELVSDAVLSLLPELKRDKETTKVFEPLDGGTWYELALTWQYSGKTEEIRYVWPDSKEADAVEHLMEEMVLSLS